MVDIPNVRLNNGYLCPILGLGTWKSAQDKVAEVVKYAIDIGYRHIDCAPVYENEKQVGDGIAAKISEGVVKRDDLFITSKLWSTHHRSDLVEEALKITLENLGLNYLDLYLIHFPFALKDGNDVLPTDKNGILIGSDCTLLETWNAMEELQRKGLTKSIGVSNFNKKQIDMLLENASIKPATNQIECHPHLVQEKLSNYCKSKGIAIIAYSSLSSSDSPWRKPEFPNALDEDLIKQIALKHNKTSAQILLKYQIQRHHICIPKSVNEKRIAENIDLWHFELTQSDIAAISTLNRNIRLCSFEIASHLRDYPFTSNDEF